MPLFFEVSQSEKIFFIEHLALMIKGGVPLPEALEILKEETKSRVLKKILTEILKNIREGKKLYSSFALYPQIFSPFLQSLVKVGEQSGTLVENLTQAARQMKKDFFLKQTVRGAMFYPLVLIFLGVLIVFGASFFVLPKLGDYFAGLNITLPFFTRALLAFSYFLRDYWRWVLVGFFSLILILKILFKIHFTRFYFHIFFLSLPQLGRILKTLYLARFSRSFYTLLRSGVPILETMDLCIEVLGNEAYKRNLIFAKKRISQGERLSQSLKRFPRTFSPIFIGLVVAGERSGTLEESFISLAKFYEKETDLALRNISRLIEPVLLMIIGIFVLFLGLSIIIPIYKFIGQLGVR